MRTIREHGDGLIRANAPVLVLFALALQVACSGDVFARGVQAPATQERSVLRRVGEAVTRAVRRIAAPAEARPGRPAEIKAFARIAPVVAVPELAGHAEPLVLLTPSVIDLPPPAAA